jgi:hypothetical protein
MNQYLTILKAELPIRLEIQRAFQWFKELIEQKRMTIKRNNNAKLLEFALEEKWTLMLMYLHNGYA